jgi:hypothetical protein
MECPRRLGGRTRGEAIERTITTAMGLGMPRTHAIVGLEVEVQEVKEEVEGEARGTAMGGPTRPQHRNPRHRPAQDGHLEAASVLA